MVIVLSLKSMSSLEVEETHYYDKELKAILVFAKQHNHCVKYS